MTDLVKIEFDQIDIEGEMAPVAVLLNQSKAGYNLLCVKPQGENGDIYTQGSIYEVVAGFGDDFTDSYGNTYPISYDEAGVIADDGELHRVLINSECESVTSGASTQFGIIKDENFK